MVFMIISESRGPKTVVWPLSNLSLPGGDFASQSVDRLYTNPNVSSQTKEKTKEKDSNSGLCAYLIQVRCCYSILSVRYEDNVFNELFKKKISIKHT